MSDNLPRLAQLVRRDLERARPIIESARLDDMISKFHEWHRVGLPTSSMGGGSGHGSGPADPTGMDATTVDEGNKYQARIVDALEQTAAGLRDLIRLDLEAPASTARACACGKALTSSARNGVCGACRRRNERRRRVA